MAHIRKKGPRRWQVRYRDPAGMERARNFRRRIDAERFLVTIEADSGSESFLMQTDLVAAAPDPLPGTLTLLIGPEGGWTPAERCLLAERGARPVGLGPHVLRTETAAVAGLAVLQTLRQAWTDPREA